MQRSIRFLAASLVAALAAAPALGQDDNDLTAEVDSVRLSGASAADISYLTSCGYRPIDLEVEAVVPPTFSAVLVKNAGAYQKTYWWYYNVTAAQVSDFLSQNSARLIDLETYLHNGQRLFTVVMISNTGEDASAWWWYYNVSWESLTALLTDNDRRPIDIETYLDGAGQRRFACVMLPGDQDWWLYSNVTIDFVSDRLSENDARLIDIEDRGAGKFTVIMVPREGHGWWWYVNVSSSFLESRRACHGSRFLDVEPVGDDLYYVIELQMTDCEGDTNGDGIVDVNDLLDVLGGWGACP
jgi:hypothetical protein